MVRLAPFLFSVVACSSPTKPPPADPAPPEPIANKTASCRNAALGLERGTKGVRAPDSSVVDVMRERCEQDGWTADAIDCFAKMNEGELGRCVLILPERSRNSVFAALGGGPPDKNAIALARARLQILAVGVPECDRFVMAVSAVLQCESMPIELRVQLGNETADFWDLPTKGLSAEAHDRMSAVCGQSLASLQQQALGAGCLH